ncbi:MAG: MerR family transcriptional regulator [Bacteroidales bacterium]|nr:MerR family transcriptional regulator [Bacteroidales bacterium]
MGKYTIKDLEKLSGIKAHTIRIWEKRYGIIIPERTNTHRRRYTDNDLRKLINIAILNRNGFKISKISSMSFREIEDRVSFVSQDLSQDDTQIKTLVIAMLNLDEISFIELINRSILNRGFEDTFNGIVFPFLRRVGVLWVTGTITPAQEHFVSNLIRQKLISNIDALISRKRESRKKVLLLLPENELHEIGLLFFAYITRKNGHEILYLGSQTPFDSVVEAVQIWHADIIVTGTLSEFSGVQRGEYLEKLSKVFNKQVIIVSGTLALDQQGQLPRNIKLARSTDEFIRLITA